MHIARRWEERADRGGCCSSSSCYCYCCGSGSRCSRASIHHLINIVVVDVENYHAAVAMVVLTADNGAENGRNGHHGHVGHHRAECVLTHVHEEIRALPPRAGALAEAVVVVHRLADAGGRDLVVVELVPAPVLLHQAGRRTSGGST